MKKLIIIAFMSLLGSLSSSAQTSSSLWKKYDTAVEKDRPKDALAVLQTITNNAILEKEWGDLLRAEFAELELQWTISADSLKPKLAELEQKALAVENGEPVLAAVYNACLGKFYLLNYPFITGKTDESKALSRQFFEKALKDKQLLADAKARRYEPLFVQGDASRTFDNDLLHVIAFEAGEYAMAREWYESHGNRAAACLSALYQVQKERSEDIREVRHSKYTATIDSLIHIYRDLPEAGELAIEHFNFMDQATDASAQEKVEYIDFAVRSWPTWPRMVVLKNARQRITLPSFHAFFNETTVIPNKEIPLYITSLINLTNLHVTVTRVDMTGTDYLDLRDAKDLKTLKAKKALVPADEIDRVYYGLPDYKSVNDTLTIKPLPLGVYLVEFTTNNSQVPVERCLLHVTDLRLVDMDLPDKKKRLIVTNATTGKPVGNAKITMKCREWKSGKMKESEEVYITEANGEVTVAPTERPYRYRVTIGDDNAMEWQDISTSWTSPFKDADKQTPMCRVYTDRAIYRPGQEVKAALVAYNYGMYNGENDVVVGETLDIEVRDADNKIHKQKVVTDEWGVASFTFKLPDTAPRRGYVRIYAKTKDNTFNSIVEVAEYKRPTFTVSIDDYTEAYKAGDTITVVGRAKTYSGIPVQGAKVVYKVYSEMARWWRFYYTGEDMGQSRTFEQEAVTKADGTFEMTVPIEKPEARGPRCNCFYSVNIKVDVTSLSGETRSGSHYLPLSDTSKALVIDGLDGKVCLEKMPEITLRLLNNSGKEIQENVSYDIDGGERNVVPANEPLKFDLTRIAEGEHTLNYYCDEDSVKQKFVLFSLNDKAPVIDTNDWYFVAAEQTPAVMMKDGEPVRVQLGTSRDDQTIYYAVVNTQKVLEEGSFVLSNANMNRDFAYQEEWGEGIAARYTWVHDGKIYSHLVRMHKPEKETKLLLEWSTFRDKLVPGQKEEWKLNIKNPDGSPAKAHLIASIYDKSLDALATTNWQTTVTHYKFTPTIVASQNGFDDELYIYGEQHFRPLIEPALEFYRIEIPDMYGIRDPGMCFEVVRVGRANAPMMAKSDNFDAASDGEVLKAKEVIAESKANGGASEPEENIDDVPLRENLDETAAFLPELVADSNGDVAIKFTLPESLTTWRFISLAHDKEMKTGLLTGEAVAQKQMMVQPNMPRFIREGDKGQLTATIANTTEKPLSGTAQMTIVNAETQKQVYQQKTKFEVKGNETTSATFTIPENLAADMYVVKVVAKAGSFSDGEQQFMPVISRKELVTTTRAITQTKPGQKVVDLNQMFGKNTENEKVTIEYTNNPAWLMIDALPAAVEECKDDQNAVSLSTALYASTLTKYIKDNVKDVTLDADTLEANATKLRTALTTLQNEDGSFSWWPNMPGNVYITLCVAHNLVRLDALIGVQQQNSQIVTRAMNFLGRLMSRETEILKKYEKEHKSKLLPSEVALDYLYLQSMNKVAGVNVDKNDVKYLLSLIKNRSKDLTIYGKANIAVAFAKSKIGGNMKTAQELIESALQYSVATEEMGRYYDTEKALYSWRDYKIPTETATIEAVQAVRPEDKQTVAEMRQWLLNEKRTQQWDTPINTTSAIFAFLNGNLASLNDVAEPVKISLDKKNYNTDGEKKGYFKVTEEGRYNKLTFDKAAEGMSWGAVYTEALQPTVDVENLDANQLSVKREIVDAEGKTITEFAVGQKVVVRLTITAGRDYDFLEVVDNRPACFEPAIQLPGYRSGYYATPGDKKTSFYFNQMQKGTRVIETEYFIDRAGAYQSGLATVSCAYAPEFSAREKAFTVNVK